MKPFRMIKIQQEVDKGALELTIHDSGFEDNEAVIVLEECSGMEVKSHKEFYFDKDDARLICAYLQSTFSL